MASKQLGKLRQWAGEVISRDKTTVSVECRELEEDLELRRHGVKRLHASSTAYHHVLSKKRDCTRFLDDPTECLPVDALGLVMILHGEEFPEDSAFGSSLIKLGRAHCKIATLQEAYAVAFRNTFLASVEKFGEEMKDYKLQRKKLESRRLSYDAAISKLEKLKATKKEKDKKDAEEEVQQAKLRYEEMSEDVRARMHSIQENEIDQLRELTAFLDLESHFVRQYAEVLKNVKTEWCHQSSVRKCEIPRGDGPLHVFAHTSVDGKTSNHSSVDGHLSPTEDSEDEAMSQPSSRGSSFVARISASTLKDSLRPSSRKRSESASAAGGGTDKEKDKDKGEKLSRRLTVAGWASSAVGSVTKRSKDKFAALTGSGGGDKSSEDEGGEGISQSFTSRKFSKSRSKDSLGTSSPKAPGKILKSVPFQDKKLVRALHDFAGSSEELSFKVGDEILVVNEVLDEWWMGELDGRKGLFPTVYTEVIRTKGTLPGKHAHAKAGQSDGSSLSSEDTEEYGSSEFEDEHLYRADHLAPARSPFYGHTDTASITSSATGEEEQEESIPENSALPPSLTRNRPLTPPLLTKRPPTVDAVAKKVPPPPPPPRRLVNPGPTLTPPIPGRRPSAFRSRSSPATPTAPMLTPSPSISSQEYETSPFESAVEFTGTGCADFLQNPFKPRGMCSNCFTMHL